jgi:hypothetical protein
MVGWDVDAMMGSLGAGASIKLPLVISFGFDSLSARAEVDSARSFYSTIYSKYMMTEIQDEGTPRVEIFNWNRPVVALGPGGLTISPDKCLSQWTGGSWSAGSIGTNTHEYYTLGGADAFPSTEGTRPDKRRIGCQVL